MENAAYAELPRYVCHKEVHAFKIKHIFPHEDGSASLHMHGSGFLPIEVSAEYMGKHLPSAGGYYVLYKDGYQSFSPAEAFEDGYTWVGGSTPPHLLVDDNVKESPR